MALPQSLGKTGDHRNLAGRRQKSDDVRRHGAYGYPLHRTMVIITRSVADNKNTIFDAPSKGGVLTREEKYHRSESSHLDYHTEETHCAFSQGVA